MHDRSSLFRLPAGRIVRATNPAPTLDPSFAVGREDRGEVSRFCRASLRAGVARLLARSAAYPPDVYTRTTSHGRADARVAALPRSRPIRIRAVDVADPRDACGCLSSISSRKASTEPKPLCPVPAKGGGVFTDMSVSSRPVSFCSTYNTKVQKVRSFSAGAHPKAGWGYGGVWASRGIMRQCVGHLTGGSRGSGRG